MQEGEVQVLARGLSGKVVLSGKREVNKGENTLILEALSLPSGIYFLQLGTERSVGTVKFVIQKD